MKLITTSIQHAYCIFIDTLLHNKSLLFSVGTSLSLLKKVLFGFCVVGIPYIKERSTEIQRITDKFFECNFVSRVLELKVIVTWI